MDRSFLDKYHRIEREHWWFRARASIITDMLRQQLPAGRTLQILNVGAATGRSTEILSEFGRVRSLEYDIPSFEYCRDVLNLDILQGSITELPYASETFDLVCAFDVVEHVEDDRQAVSELMRVCRPGGLVFLTVPAFMSLWSDHDIVNLHYRRYQQPELVQLFSTIGGRIVRSTYFNTLLFPPIWLARRLQRLLKPNAETMKPDNEWMQNRFTDRIFHTIFSSERFLLNRGNLPFGVSLAALWRKNDEKSVQRE